MPSGDQAVVQEERAVALPWYKEISRYQWKVFVAAGLGYGLEAMDMMLYAMVILEVMKELQMNPATGGLVASLSLFSAAFGGIAFGVYADKMGRTKSLMLSILVYSIFTAACGFSQTVTQLIIFRVLLGIGLGGEWTAGAALITEAWPPQHRGKAMGLVQANFGVGYALAAIVTMIVLPNFGWRAVFFVGVIPALLTFFVRRNIKEPEIWTNQKAQALKEGEKLGTIAAFGILFGRKYASKTIISTLLCSFCLFAYWGAFTWIPGYLAMPVEKGGAGLTVFKSLTWIVIMQCGGICGHLTFGYIQDKIGRKISCIIFFFMSGVLTVVYGMIRDPTVLLLIGPFLAYFGYGYYASFGAILAEIFPTAVRATGTGLAYNVGRGVSSFGPAVVGILAMKFGLGAGIAITAIAYAFAIVLVSMLPETKGKILD
jgi:MFS family permease